MYNPEMQLMSSHSYAFQPRPAKGGLVHVVSHGGSAKTQTALLASLRSARVGQDYFFWAADQGILYPEAIHQEWQIPLQHLLIVQAPDAPEVWRVGLEAAQTGLFRVLFLRASSACQTAALRKLQLAAEKNQCEVFLLTSAALPHWTLKETIEAGKNAHTPHSKPQAALLSRGKLFHPHAESLPLSVGGTVPGYSVHPESFGW
jgi:hypothetical protein